MMMMMTTRMMLMLLPCRCCCCGCPGGCSVAGCNNQQPKYKGESRQKKITTKNGEKEVVASLKN